MIRVLVAEDSSTARRLLVEVLNEDPELEVVGEAKNGLEALAMTRALQPDVVTMDVHMPVLDGLAATRRIMSATPVPIVIVSGVLDPDDVEASMSALRDGALAVMRKLEGPGGNGFEAACRELCGTVKAMADVRVVRRRLDPPEDAGPSRTPRVPRVAAEPVALVALAASTGGPTALQQVLAGLPEGLGAPVLIVQHIGRGFTAGFAEWLGRTVPQRVKLAVQGERLAAGTVYIAPDDQHLGVTAQGRVALSGAEAVGGFRPAATWLFREAGQAFGARALGVVLTGMGEDGADGLEELRARGGAVIAQDRESSVVFGMPGAAVARGLATQVLPLGDIAAAVRAAVSPVGPHQSK